MKRVIIVLVLVVLWAVWADFFFGAVRLGYALTGSVFPELPSNHYSRVDLVEWLLAVAALYGSPLLLVYLTWRIFTKRRRLPKNGVSA